MRPLIKYGIPAAAGLAVGGMLAQDQQPGVAALGGLGAALGTAAGLKGARSAGIALAGKYAPQAAGAMQAHVITPLGKQVKKQIDQIPAERQQGFRATALGDIRQGLLNIDKAAHNVPPRALQVGAAGLAVPTSAGLAALGGQAAGMIPGALNVPGFAPQQQSIDPESYGSSNSPGARYKQTTGSAGITGYYQ
jgi:hypothetical protein